MLSKHGVKPATIVEPTCGIGNFVKAATTCFLDVYKVIAVDINPSYISQARRCFANAAQNSNIELVCADFFGLDWNEILRDLPSPILVVGNFPWVTNAGTGAINGSNLPTKTQVATY